MTAAIQIRKLIYSPARGPRPAQPASDSPRNPLLNIAAWDVAAGERIFLYGPSGSGKTSLLNLISGMVQADSGEIRINNTDISSLGARARDRFRQQTTGVIFQQFNLLPYLSSADNIRLGLLAGSWPADKSRLATLHTQIEQLLARLRLPHSCLHQKAGSLSVGQQQRVAIARALIKSPALIIADEPTSALDEETRSDFINTLLECAGGAGSTVLFVSHEHSLGRHFDKVVDLRSLNTASDAAAGNHYVC